MLAGVAASWGEVEKDAHYEEAVHGAGMTFIPLAVETLGLWSPASFKVLRDIAIRATNRSGAGIAFGLPSFSRTNVCVFMEAQCPHVHAPLCFVAC